MITSNQPVPYWLVNRDLKRELRLLPPGYEDTVRNTPVKRLTGKRSHMYSIYGFAVDLDCAADVIAGYTPMPPHQPVIVQLELPLFAALGAA